MEVKYRIEDRELALHLEDAYGLRAASIHFIPMGDSAYSYRVTCADGERCYLKLFDHRNGRQRDGIGRLQHYLPLTWRLYHEGLLRNIAYPILNRSGSWSTTFNAVTVVLFNFIEGETLADAYPFPQEIVESVAVIAADIHRLTPYIDQGSLLSETGDLSFAPDLEKCMTLLEHAADFGHPVKQALRAHVLPKLEQIAAMLGIARQLRSEAVADTRQCVLCHGDLWGGNLIRRGNELHVVDWEAAIAAPREYDLFGYMGEQFAVFYAAYVKQTGHAVTLNPDVLRFYAYRHHLRNLTNWLMNILHRNTEERQNEHDLDLILHHCMNRWDRIESQVQAVEAIVSSTRDRR